MIKGLTYYNKNLGSIVLVQKCPPVRRKCTISSQFQPQYGNRAISRAFPYISLASMSMSEYQKSEFHLNNFQYHYHNLKKWFFFQKFDFKDYRARLLMIAFIFVMGTKYDCNDDHNGNLNAILKIKRTIPIYDCNLFQRGPNMIAISKIVPGSRTYHFWPILAKTNCWCLQSYLVPFERDCNYIWSDSQFTLQSYHYLVPFCDQDYNNI